MIDILTKPADQLGINDLQALIDSSVQEDEQIEFKRGLSAEKGTTRSLVQWREVGQESENRDS